ncbi:MAG TPA: SGNH/GDSL hydrolase family protein [Vicinamibacteria bacterium]|nr:SGNH/GDSL hydrolase family protein [Vicinamibacteria bacterium]
MASPEPRSPRFESLRARYTALAILLLNSVLLLLVVVPLFLGGRWLVGRLARPRRDPVTERHGKLAAPTSEQEALLRETWSRPFVYEPFVQFGERPFAGRYVNVTAAGFRVGVDQGPWPPRPANFNVFVFGGSTTFGYGVRDEMTVPSFIQQRLGTTPSGRPVRVYNFGRGNYYLSQERVLYERLLVAGLVPDLAVFVDGLNDLGYFADEPAMTPQLVKVFEDEYAKWRRTNEAWTKDLPASTVVPPAHAVPADEAGRRAAAERVLDRYQRSMKAVDGVAAAFGTRARFVWHPCSLWGLDPRLHPFAPDRNELAPIGYEMMSRRRAGIPGFIWCADVQRDAQAPLYVDSVHFGPELSRRVAACIADGLGRLEP